MSHSKRNDPSTSWDAGDDFHESIKPEYHYQLIQEVFKTNGPMTSAEISMLCDLDRYQVARRLPEMERRNSVIRAGIRVCSVKKRKSVVWVGRGR